MRLTVLLLIASILVLPGFLRASDTVGPLENLVKESDLAASVFLMAADADPKADIESSQKIFEHLVQLVKERSSSKSTVSEKIEALATVLAEQGFTPAENGRRASMLLPAVLETHRGNCMGFSLLYASLAQRLELPLRVGLIPEHAFIVSEEGPSRQFIETLAAGARHKSFSDFLDARSSSAGTASGARSERPALDSFAETLRTDERLQLNGTIHRAVKPVLLDGPRDILALLLTQAAGEMDSRRETARCVEYCRLAVELSPRLAVAYESLGHFLNQQGSAAAAREQLLVASTLQEESGWLTSALRSAASAGNADRVRELLKKGANVHWRDSNGRAALHFANSAECVHALLRAGAERDLAASDGSTPLHFAAKLGNGDALEALLSAGARTADTDASGRTPLHAAAMFGQSRIVEKLLRAGADANAVTSSGGTPLHLAAETGDERTVSALLKGSAQASFKNGNGATALNVSAAHGHTEAARALLVAGSAPSEPDSDGITPLHWAARKGNDELVALLLSRDADPNARDRQQRTPLIFCAFSGNEVAAKLLLDKGADPLACSNQKRTALHHAAYFNHVALMKLLIEKGADTQAIDIYSRTPMDYCSSATRDSLNK